jgi:hypothetical protein
METTTRVIGVPKKPNGPSMFSANAQATIDAYIQTGKHGMRANIT